MAVEVELQRKANHRLRGILDMYYDWIEYDGLAGVIYVCRNESLANRIDAVGKRASVPEGSLRTLLLDQVREEASQAQLPLWHSRSAGRAGARAS